MSADALCAVGAISKALASAIATTAKKEVMTRGMGGSNRVRRISSALSYPSSPAGVSVPRRVGTHSEHPRRSARRPGTPSTAARRPSEKSAGRAVSSVAWHDGPRTGVEARLARLVLVVAPHPQRLGGALVATLRRPVEEGVVRHAGRLEAARRGHVGPVD